MYRRMAPNFETKGAAEHRQEMLGEVSGRVVEVGAGTGLNFKYYPASVTEVVAVEPEPRLRAVASEAAKQASVPIIVVDGTADHLPLETGSCDVGVASLVLCSVANQRAALAELQRVIRPAGELRFYEHVLSKDPKWAARQRRMAPIWRLFVGGCSPDRDTAAAITDAGFEITESRDLLFAPAQFSQYTAPHIIGRARRS
jgi:SAM-dependent methyltransferase